MFSDAKNQLSTSATLALALILSLIVVIAPATSERASAYMVPAGCDLVALGATGAGSIASPFGISTAAQLWEVTDCPGGNFELLNDIDVAGVTGVTTQSPIGTDQVNRNRLVGVLDGKDHTISFSMSVNGSAALFNSINGAEIRNLTLSGTVRSNPSSALYTAGLAISAEGRNTISNVTSNLNIRAKSYVGGFVGTVVGSATLSILNSRVLGVIEAIGGMSGSDHYVGGFLGRSNTSTVIFSGSSSLGAISAAPTVIATGGFIGQAENSSVLLSNLTRSGTVRGGENASVPGGTGGLVGVLSLGVATISGTTVIGEVASPRRNSGGLVGFSSANLVIQHSKNEASVSAGFLAGGLIGWANQAIQIISSSNTGTVTGTSQIGGVIGYSTKPVSFMGVTNSGTVIATATSSGGLIGQADDSIQITSSSNTGSVTGTSQSGGVIGYSTKPVRFQGVLNTGTVSATDRFAGGFIGRSDDEVQITSSQNAGGVSGPSRIGGMVGYSTKPVSFMSVTNSGRVSATGSFAGGFIGWSDGAVRLENSTNLAQVSGTESVGGLIGRLSNSASISVSQNVGAIESPNSVGGFIGYANGAGSRISIASSQNGGAISGTNSVGGFIGRADNPSIHPSVSISDSINNSSGTISGSGNVGGLIGGSAGAVLISGSQNAAAFFGTNRVGGLIGQSSGVTHVHFSQNSGNSTGAGEGRGGLVGEFNGGAIHYSYNTGNIVGYGAPAGLVGVHDSGAMSLASSWNLGSVEGDERAGGLVGEVNSSATLSISLSYNVGPVSTSGANGRAGGLVGLVQDGGTLEISSSYNVGVVTGIRDTDGLVGSSSAVATQFVYSSGASRYVSPSLTIAQMKIGATYVGFNFTDDWAFGSCSVNNGFPVLRWPDPSGTWFPEACDGVVINSSNQQNNAGPNPSQSAPPQPPTAYSGPLVNANQMIVFRGESFELRGTKLDVVTSVSIPGLELKIVSASSTSMTLTMPSSASLGLQDLLMVSSFGRLSVVSALDVRQRPVVVSQFGNLLGFGWSERFQGASRVLSPFQVSRVKLALANFPAATSVVCWGYAAAVKPSPSAIAQATQRATSLCQAVSKAQPNLKTFIRVRFGVAPSATMRTAMQFWELKATN